MPRRHTNSEGMGCDEDRRKKRYLERLERECRDRNREVREKRRKK